jgi:putative ABC transport system permease protein
MQTLWQDLFFGARMLWKKPGVTLGITLLQGRAFSAQDKADATPVVIVNETLAKRFFPNNDAVGKRFRFRGDLSPTNPWREIVGVIADVRHDLNTPLQPEYYRPHTQAAAWEMMLAVRTRTEPAAMATAIRSEVQLLDRDLPVFQVRTMQQVRQQSVLLQSFSFSLLSVFAVVALLLAAVGIYGVMSYSVSQRTHEIGIRMALGARTGDVMRMVVRQGMKLTAIGVAIGLVGSMTLVYFASAVLAGTGLSDWPTFTGVALILAFVAFVACWLPARRATKVDPLIALRYE